MVTKMAAEIDELRSPSVTGMAPAAWFARNTLISADCLRKSRVRGRLKRWQKSGGRYLYDRAEVFAAWPDLFHFKPDRKRTKPEI